MLSGRDSPGICHRRLEVIVSIKSLLMPMISQRLLSRERLDKHRARIERNRQSRGEPHRIRYFHQIDDPYSALSACSLPLLAQRYRIEIDVRLVGPPADAAAPERAMLVNYSRVDAQRLAHRHGLWFRDPGEQPGTQRVQQAGRLLLDAIGRGDIVTQAEAISRDLWRGAILQDAMLQSDRLQGDSTGGQLATSEALASHLLASQALRRKQGHYLGATVLYGGEWYWGIDRLHHLERRLQSLGAQRDGVADLLYPPGDELATVHGAGAGAEIDYFFSFRSPYSAIVTPRVFALARQTGARVNLRYLLPMVMRGLPVPAEKRGYIAADAAREAHWRGTPFGRVNDPVGRPTDRGLALIPLAEKLGRGEAYVSAFMHGVWAEGIDAGSDRGLRLIAHRAGLPWADARDALQDDSWRDVAERNRQAMFALGIWGVPSFAVGDTAVWGQDRLWAVQEALVNGGSGLSRSEI
jgi:2-hydroxychromene-2-carboxylate isomerase